MSGSGAALGADQPHRTAPDPSYSLFGAPEQEALRAALPQARFEAFPGLGPNMFWEQPEQVGQLLAGFLDE